ncbi:MAG: 3-oxoacyl-ACP reductase FabG [Paludibacteraceae bacterium]|nr:3-oxoacyl-ACP reductase FabG [Paludibacteraceae bacterium]
MKYALVTGGSRGIGRAICVQLAKDGYSVIINYKSNHAAAEETLRLIREVGGTAELLPFDVSDMDAVNAAMDKWETTHQDDFIDVLVNNAGIIKDDVLLGIEPNDWHAVVDININGFYYVTRRVLSNMIINHHGRIINMSSIAATHPFKGQVNYSAAKAAIEGATRSLAVEVAPKQITVNAIAPGLIATELLYNSAAEHDNLDIDIKKIVPMRRLGLPEEVAYLASFLASDKAAYISGQVIGINGMYGTFVEKL